MSERRLYLDPDLSLGQVARRLGVPAKILSAAVNRRGENVSRTVNADRVAHAIGRIDAGASITAAMLDSGFNTKSNVNREFLRVTGVPPSRWRAQRRAEGDRATQGAVDSPEVPG